MIVNTKREITVFSSIFAATASQSPCCSLALPRPQVEYFTSLSF